MAVETLDRRTALEEAFDSAEADAKGEVYTPPVHEAAPESEPTTETPPETPDPGTVESKATEQPKVKDRPRTRGVPPDERGKIPEQQQQPEGEQPANKVSNLDKAPLGWGPKRDEMWNRVPADIRQMITKRETESQHAMSQAGRIRKIAEEYHQVIMPFENIIKSMGTTPSQAIKEVMTTATALIIGTPQQKVAVVAEMVQRYGVDLPTLDKVLTEALKNGGGRLQGGPNQGEEALLARIMPRLKPLYDLQTRLQEADGQRHERLTHEATEAINSVQNEPYFEDVKQDIADIMEISANRGRVIDIKQAYQKACELHPEISKMVGARRPSTPANVVARARRASSTVRGAPGGPVSPIKGDRRAALEAAWNEQ